MFKLRSRCRWLLQRSCHTEYPHQSIIPTTSRGYSIADAEHGCFIRALHTDTPTCLASAVAEIHSSERLKPSEVSVRLKLVLSSFGSPSRSGVDALSLLEYVRGLLSSWDTVSSA
jgi:hypothetical protein